MAPYWWRPARTLKPFREPNPVGRPTRYPVHILEVGEHMILEWYKLPDGCQDLIEIR